MSMFDGISQVQVGLGRNINKTVRKWTDEQTDLFAGILTQKHFKNGRQSTWSEELETLAVKKSSNEHVFKEIQVSLEQQLDKFDQSYREGDDEATFTISQLRAKYKWLKREWKVIQNKIKCGLLSEDAKLPNWFSRLHHIFTVYIDADRQDRDDDRPSMVSENGSLLNGHSSIDDNNSSDDCPDIGERSWIVNIEPPQADIPAVNDEKNHRDVENDSVQHEEQSRKRHLPTNEAGNPSTKIRKLKSCIRELNNTSDYTSFPSQCGCKLDADRYIEIIKNILNAEERREKMLVDFQREQAQLSRQHELKMAQMFMDMASQQRNLVAEIGSIKEMILSKK